MIEGLEIFFFLRAYGKEGDGLINSVCPMIFQLPKEMPSRQKEDGNRPEYDPKLF